MLLFDLFNGLTGAIIRSFLQNLMIVENAIQYSGAKKEKAFFLNIFFDTSQNFLQFSTKKVKVQYRFFFFVPFHLADSEGSRIYVFHYHS